jgi:hypothetical protein
LGNKCKKGKSNSIEANSIVSSRKEQLNNCFLSQIKSFKGITAIEFIFFSLDSSSRGKRKKRARNQPMPSRMDKLGLIISAEFTKKMSPIYK